MSTFKKAAVTDATSQARPAFDAATWHLQAELLARNQARGETFGVAARWLIPIDVALVAGTAAAVALDMGGPEWLLVIPAALALEAVWMLRYYWTAYSDALLDDTEHTRQATWRREVEENIDLDGDGEIGHPVRIGTTGQTFVLPNREAHNKVPLAGWPVYADDLIYILLEAKTRGIGIRQWRGSVLPSGLRVTLEGGSGSVRWSELCRAMVNAGMATVTTDAAGREFYALADIDIESTIEAIRNLKS